MTLLEQAQDILKQLSPEKLQIAVDFLAYIQDKESQEATDELLSIPNFEKELKEAQDEINQDESVSFHEIRRLDNGKNIQTKMQEDFKKAGIETDEQILELIRDVKKELLEERFKCKESF
ncbi:MAG: hypothetical protein AB4058_07650 [Microcystaceae cyanobacterium]